MFNRFTERARKVIVYAKEEARRFNHDYIGTEHLLLGLVREGEGVAAAVVLKSGKTVEAQELQELVRVRLRSSRVPQLMKFWDELPYNETGKLLRRIVKAELSQ